MKTQHSQKFKTKSETRIQRICHLATFPFVFNCQMAHRHTLSFPYNLTCSSNRRFPCPGGVDELIAGWELGWAGCRDRGTVPRRKEAPTLASKKSLAPLTPSRATSISESFASAISPLSSCSSPAAALWNMSRNCGGRLVSQHHRETYNSPLRPELQSLQPRLLQTVSTCPRDKLFFFPYHTVNTENMRKFPGSPVVKTPCFHCRGCGFDPWSGKLRSHMPRDTVKKTKQGVSLVVQWLSLRLVMQGTPT